MNDCRKAFDFGHVRKNKISEQRISGNHTYFYFQKGESAYVQRRNAVAKHIEVKQQGIPQTINSRDALFWLRVKYLKIPAAVQPAVMRP